VICGARLSQPQRAASLGRVELLTLPPFRQHDACKLRNLLAWPRAAAETAALRRRLAQTRHCPNSPSPGFRFGVPASAGSRRAAA